MLETFRKRLEEARKTKGWSRSQLEMRSGVGSQTIYNIERCVHGPSLYTTVNLADALDVSLDWLVGRE